MDTTDFLSKILWDLSNVDESILSHPQLVDIRVKIAEYLGLIDDNPQLPQDTWDSGLDDYTGCQYCGDGDMDPITECPQCS